MNAKLTTGKSAFWTGLLGTALLVAGPAAAHADQGKWWNPREGGRQVRTQPYRSEQYRRPGHMRGDRLAWRDYRRYGRVYRDHVVLRGAWGGPYAYRARRYWVRPWYQGHYIYVRPVRYFVAADACIGGVSISARFHPHDRWFYGCNFCDARFDHYDHWAAHVGICPYRPDGYRVRARYWDHGYPDRDDERDWRGDEYRD